MPLYVHGRSFQTEVSCVRSGNNRIHQPPEPHSHKLLPALYLTFWPFLLPCFTSPFALITNISFSHFPLSLSPCLPASLPPSTLCLPLKWPYYRTKLSFYLLCQVNGALGSSFGIWSDRQLAVCSQQIECDKELSSFSTPAILVSALQLCNLQVKGHRHILGPIIGYDYSQHFYCYYSSHILNTCYVPDINSKDSQMEHHTHVCDDRKNQTMLIPFLIQPSVHNMTLDNTHPFNSSIFQLGNRNKRDR